MRPGIEARFHPVGAADRRAAVRAQALLHRQHRVLRGSAEFHPTAIDGPWTGTPKDLRPLRVLGAVDFRENPPPSRTILRFHVSAPIALSQRVAKRPLQRRHRIRQSASANCPPRSAIVPLRTHKSAIIKMKVYP
jgi:hypothetical protein